MNQLHDALCRIPLAEFMKLSRTGRAAYGALFDELTEAAEAEGEDDVLPAPPRGALPAAPKPRLASTVPPPPREFRKVTPLPPGSDTAAWAHALTAMGLDPGTAVAALKGQGRELWVRGETQRYLQEVGLPFTGDPDPGLDANVGTDMHVN